MSSVNLRGLKIAILATDGFEQSELIEPQQALIDAGGEVMVVSPKEGFITGWDRTDWGDDVEVDLSLEQAFEMNFHALVLPGGVLNPDKLRTNSRAVHFVRNFFREEKPVAAICHGPQLLIEAGVLQGRKVTSWPSLQTDLRNAGANWVNQPVVVDGGLVTSRMPQDIPEFNERIIEIFALRNFARDVNPNRLTEDQPRP